jgi:uroporphyrinogen decarboxylase
MTPRQRLLATLAHTEPDRIPFDLSSTPVTGIHRVAYQSLREALALPQRDVEIFHLMQQLAVVHDDVHVALRTDVRGSRPLPPTGWRLELQVDGDYEYYTDDWGITRRRIADDGHYFDLCGSPLANAGSPQDIDSYDWPEPAEPPRFQGLRARAEAIRDAGFPFVLGGICPGMMEMGQWLRGFDNFYCDLAADRPMAEALCDQIIRLKLEYWSYALREVGDLVDVIQEGDDYGGQQALQVHPDLWREVFKPRLRQLLTGIKADAPHAALFFHSCGAVRDILPDLIEVGVDILNPVQVSATGMDSAQLKSEFGDDLVFWGGGVDTQHVLPTGTPAQVADEVRRRVDDFAPGGGFVFNAVHNIQADVPAANILAMRAALDECTEASHDPCKVASEGPFRTY